MQKPDDSSPFRQHIRQYGPFTPAALAVAAEMGRRLPLPVDAHIKGSPCEDNPMLHRHTITIPKGVTYRLQQFADARGISFNRLCGELLTYYVCAVSDEQIDMIPAFYSDLLAPKAINVLAQAIALAQDKLGMVPLERPIVRASDAAFGSDITPEEKERLQNW